MINLKAFNSPKLIDKLW